MFDITPDEIKQLNDTDLRELVGRLCEAELTGRGHSAAATTWGGNQTSADGGLDVRVALPKGVSIEGFIPRPSTGFQVKKPDMPRSEIIKEMRPRGGVRRVIEELAREAGAYVIVSATGSTTDSVLRTRRDAMHEALDGVPGADQLYTDFYDRTRMASWVRQYPGLIAWVKERVGRAIAGWYPYGPWSTAAEGVDAEYLLDDKLRLHFGRRSDNTVRSVAEAIDALRDELAQPGKIVRLVGLSGVGKTRFVQALFDARIGSRALPPSLAVYTNLSDDPDPQPTGLVSDLIANRKRAVVIVDNCPPELHRRLSDLCNGQTSTVSLITVEYDVRDDQPESTQVVTLDTSSAELIEGLVRRRYRHLSQVDARNIAEASGGNARIAVALAETVGHSDSIAGLSNDELFQRLFRQRQDPNNALLLAAQACSLVYSFDGEAMNGEDAELPRLATLAGQTAPELYRHVGELLRRDLAQRRGVWRAVLPHAIANRLAAQALEDTPYRIIDQQLVSGGTKRLMRSFSRRLSFLHDHPKATDIVKTWLAPDGLLGDVTTLDEFGQAMFKNVAPVLPEATLAALERTAGSGHADVATMVGRQHRSLLHSLAYDPDLFERSAQLLAQAVTDGTDDLAAEEVSDTFVSLFTIYLSGTHATIEQRLGVIEPLLRSAEPKARALGSAALDATLKATHFSSSHQFEFGARSRDYGFRPRSNADVVYWYGAALNFLERLALAEETLSHELRALVARNFRGLWTSAHMYGELERICRMFSAAGFWREAWAACRETMYFDRDRLTPEAVSRLSGLEAELRPSTLQDRARAVLLDDVSGEVYLGDGGADGSVTSAVERLQESARELGAAVATDIAAFNGLLADLLRGGSRAWAFGGGLASASPDPLATWERLVEGLEQSVPEQRDVQVLRGYLAELGQRDKELVQSLLDSAVTQPALLEHLPPLHSAVGLDERGVGRLMLALGTRRVPVWPYRYLAFGQATDPLAGGVLKELLLQIAAQPEGFNVALEILYMRLYSDRSAQREYDPALLEAGRELLQRVTFERDSNREDHELAGVAKASLTGPDAETIAFEIAGRMRRAVTARRYSINRDELLKALLELQPVAVLDALFSGGEEEQRAAVGAFEHLGDHRGNPIDAVSCSALIAWCEGDRQRRYPVAAKIITFAHRPEASEPTAWSEQAKALLASAPDSRRVLTVFVERFRPSSWSGSRAALIEANARLLDSLESLVPPALMQFVAEAKSQLAQDVERARRWETEWDQARDERFE